jgi:hypothetical protein
MSIFIHIKLPLRKYTCNITNFRDQRVATRLNTSVAMPRRALGVLKNLGNWAKENTKRTILAKLKKGGKKDDKENVSVTSHSYFISIFK